VLRIGVLVLGVTDVQRAAVFWSEALGYSMPADGLLTPSDGSGIEIVLQRSETVPQDRPRLHLDLHVAGAAEQEAEVDRLISLGAQRVDWDSYPEDPDFVVLADTEGNRFCIVDFSYKSGN
jgi:hypothetical protein